MNNPVQNHGDATSTPDLANNLFDANDVESNMYTNIKHSCNYYEPDHFKEKYSHIKNQLSFLSLNIRSLPNKFSELTELMQELNSNMFKFSIIALQEIWNVPTGFSFSLPGYKPMMFSIRDKSGANANAGGGVGIFVDEKFECEIIEQISVFKPKLFESQFIKVKTSKNKFIIIGNIYRPNSAPIASTTKFNDELEIILNKIRTDNSLRNNSDIILLGDYNIDLIKYNTHSESSRYLEILLSHGQLPVISKPTRICQNTASLIDHISIKDHSSFLDSGVLLTAISDHCPTFYIKTFIMCNQKVPPPQKTRKINPDTIKVFKQLLQNHKWENVLNENRPSNAFCNYFETINKLSNDAFPEVKKFISRKHTPINPWMTKALLISRKYKNKLAAKKIKFPSDANIEAYKQYNKIYNKLCRKAKLNYYSEQFKMYSKDVKKTWDIIREAIGGHKIKNSIPDLFFENGELISGSLNIAEGFNTFFSEIGKKLAAKIPENNIPFQNYLKNEIEENFTFAKITKKTILEIGGQLKPKHSSGHDNISSNLLKIILPDIVNPVCHLFNLSINTGYIPTELKTAKVVPIFKADSVNSFNNYRPISLLTSLSKLLEKIVSRQIIGFLNKHNILYKLQFGFRKGHNTSHPVIHFLDKIYNALNKEKPEFTLGIFLDLCKAFDTANHEILLEKMKHYGFRGLSSLWFKNYLNGRKQFVTINGVDSTCKFIDVGVPQGSVLGPLLFLILINDLPNSVNFLTLLFADDTTFQKCGNEPKQLFSDACSELAKAAEWFKSNRLSLNISKTKFILFRTKFMKVDLKEIKLNIGGQVIERIGTDCETKSFKFVGHHLDEFLSWDEHIKKVRNKLACANFKISQTKNILPINIRINLYNSLFRPYLEYGIVNWGGVAKSKLAGIINLQKRCVRNVINSHFLSHTEPIFQHLKILKFNDLYKYNCLKFMHLLSNTKQPLSFNSIFIKLHGSRTNNFLTSNCKLQILKQFPMANFPKFWNALTFQTKNITSLSLFTREILRNMFALYSSSVHCNNLQCRDCT